MARSSTHPFNRLSSLRRSKDTMLSPASRARHLARTSFAVRRSTANSSARQRFTPSAENRRSDCRTCPAQQASPGGPASKQARLRPVSRYRQRKGEGRGHWTIRSPGQLGLDAARAGNTETLFPCAACPDMQGRTGVQWVSRSGRVGDRFDDGDAMYL